MPVRRLTPGKTLDVSVSDVCVSGYSKKIRNVPWGVKKQVLEDYRIATHLPYEYEVDHLIPLSIGGSNSKKNLWPEPMGGILWNAKVKDRLEQRLHNEVCKRRIQLEEAQQEIAVDWIAAYKKHFKTSFPLLKGRRDRESMKGWRD